MKKLFKCALVLPLVLLIFPVAFAAGNAPVAKRAMLDIRATDTFVYVPLGTNKTTKAFFTLTNNSNTTVSVTTISSRAAKQLRLVPDAPLVLPAKQSVALQSSKGYVQINDLQTQLRTGDEFPLDISLSNGQQLHLVAVAKSAYDQPHSR